jgi:hypothetical protein
LANEALKLWVVSTCFPQYIDTVFWYPLGNLIHPVLGSLDDPVDFGENGSIKIAVQHGGAPVFDGELGTIWLTNRLALSIPDKKPYWANKADHAAKSVSKLQQTGRRSSLKGNPKLLGNRADQGGGLSA